MKKTLLVFGCLVSSSLCVASSAQQALPYDYYNLRDNAPHGLYTVNDRKPLHVNIEDPFDCPVPSPKKKTPAKDKDSFEQQRNDSELNEHFAAFILNYYEDCPVPSPKKK